MNMPPRFREFLNIVAEDLYYHPQSIIAILNEHDLVEKRFKKNDVDKFESFLYEQSVIVHFNSYTSWHWATNPSKEEDRLRRMGRAGFWASMLPSILRGLSQDQIIMQLASRDKFFEFYQQSTEKKASAFQISGSPIFDEARGEITWGEKKCDIPMSTNMFCFCKVIFQSPIGTKIPTLDISESPDWESSSSSGVYDALRSLNTKVKQSLGLDKFFLNQGEYVWINEKLFKP